MVMSINATKTLTTSTRQLERENKCNWAALKVNSNIALVSIFCNTVCVLILGIVVNVMLVQLAIRRCRKVLGLVEHPPRLRSVIAGRARASEQYLHNAHARGAETFMAASCHTKRPSLVAGCRRKSLTCQRLQ